MKQKLFYILALLSLLSCSGRQKADFLVYNARIYTVDKQFTIAEAFVVAGGKIIGTGIPGKLRKTFEVSKEIDLHGKYVYPGFIDAHCHFYGYGTNLQKVALEGTKSYREVLEKVQEFSKTHQGEWIQGRGWDQNDWDVKQYPDKAALDSLFPATPVFLQRVDGHAALVNQAALDRAGITAATKTDGGEIVKINGKLSGVLIDNAVDLVQKKITKLSPAQMSAALLGAQSNCFAAGLTTVDDAGLDRDVIELIDSLQKKDLLKMKVYAMISATDENKKYYFSKGKYKTDRLSVCSFKVYADGALGSRGACLLKPYEDMKDHQGFLLHPLNYFEGLAAELDQHGFQMNTHCIGDSSNRYILNVYGAVLKGKNDKRWRIEHAQVVSPGDFHKFGAYSIIPSVQPTHATSDMYWAKDRIGARISGAYAYRQLLAQNGMIADGSDFPVEDINPLYGFYAAVVRKDKKNYPEGGFQPENAISREEALKAMTIWAAYANFEEKDKGSLEPGKSADFVVLEEDIMKVAPEKLWQIKVLETYVNGEQVYKKQ